ncbi:MAG: SLBB domain-containing protein, partial [bacterium]
MRVFVLGGVRRPGSHPVSALSRVSDAIRAAGGLSVGSMR